MRYVYLDRIRLGVGWVICCYDKILIVVYVGGNNIKCIVVVVQGNGEDVYVIG